MIKAREWPVRAMYILIAAALALSLFITAAPAHNVSAATNNVKAEWERVSTPTMEDWVLTPNSTIIDYALASEGDVAYAIVKGYNSAKNATGFWLLKSEDGAATWTDLTEELEKVRKAENITELISVATDGEDPEFVAVALNETGVRVFVSKDGGTTFKDAGVVNDVVYFATRADVSDLAVSLEGADGEHDIAIGGRDNNGASALFRCTVTAGIASAWEDATNIADYSGWDDEGEPGNFTSRLVTNIIFSPDWANDRTILAVTVNGTSPYTVHLQSGTWGETGGAWNKDAGFVNAVPIKSNVYLPISLPSPLYDARAIAGVLLPSDYSGENTNTRYAWVWVNYRTAPGAVSVGEIIRVKNGLHTSINVQIEGMPVLSNVSYWGTIDEGKAIAGALGDGKGGYAEPCTGVQVYHKGNIQDMDICCPAWEEACKLPTGKAGMAVSYVSADKAYAVALGASNTDIDESAWSVSLDGDGLIWNQLSLVDTCIDYLSDVAVSPDCNKMMLVSVNGYFDGMVIPNGDDGQYVWMEHGDGCDSVWLKADTLPEAEEYSGHWIRTYCFQLAGVNDDQYAYYQERGFLRLAPEEDNGMTVYLVDRMTGTIYYNDMETWNCWETRSAKTEIDKIVDLAVKDESTIYALGYNGYVSMSDDHGKAITWTDAVDTALLHGWSIAVWSDDVDRILVGGQNGDCDYSADGGETWKGEEPTPKDTGVAGLVTVAFDSYFDINNTFYAALALAGADNDIYRWVFGESEDWEAMGAQPLESEIGLPLESTGGNYTDDLVPVDFTGLVLGFKDGNPKTSAETGGVLYASYVGPAKLVVTGVARSLNPAESIECKACVEWDYLHVGLTANTRFLMGPNPPKLCGCMQPTTNTRLFAIGLDYYGYDMLKAKYGTVWTFEDCYAKKAPEVTFPTGNTTIPADPCSCYNAPFTVKWDALCDACEYQIEFALDEEFSATMPTIEVPPTTGAPSYLMRGGEEGGLSCEMTYYMRIRAFKAGTGQVIHSWWSEPLKLTIAPSVGSAAITLVSPAPGATGVAVKNLGFSWNLLASANKFDWVLSKNADLSTPLDSKTVTTKAATYTGTLDYGTTYYWQVTAWEDSAQVSKSAIGTFTTAATGAFCCPIDGLCFASEQALKDHNAAEHPAQPVTPMWVWVVIAIGAVLVIVVIVLIFRTRRV